MNFSVPLIYLPIILSGIVFLCAHLRPGVVYPLEGMLCAVGLVVLALASGWGAKENTTPVLAKSASANRSFRNILPGVFLLAFTAWVWLRTAFSAVPTDGAEFLGNFLLGLAAFCLASQLTRRLPAVASWIAILFTALAFFIACHATLEYHYLYVENWKEYTSRPTFNPKDPTMEGIAFALQERRVSSAFGNPNVLAGFLTMCMPLLVALAWKATEPNRKLKRIGLACAGLLIGYAAFRTRSSGGLIMLALGLGLCAIAVGVAKKRMAKIALASLMLGALIFLPGAAETTKESAPPPRAARTLEQRAFYLQSAWAMFKQSPIIGHGLGGYARLYPQARIPRSSETAFAHNFVAQLAVETGAVGVGLFLAFIGSIVMVVWRGKRQAESLAITAAALLFLLDSLGDYTFFVREVYVDFCLLAGTLWGLSALPFPAKPFRRTYWASAALCAAGLVVSVVPTQMLLHDKQIIQDLWSELHPNHPDSKQIILDSWEIAEELLRKNPNNPSVLQLHSFAAFYVGRPETAFADLQKAVNLNPYSAQLRANLARCEWERAHKIEALEWAGKAIELYPLKAEHYMLRANYLQKMGRTAEALADAKKANEVAFTPLEQAESAKLLETLTAEKP